MDIEAIGPRPAGLPNVLLVEDNPDDILLTRRAVRKAGMLVSLSVATDGDEAVAYLDGLQDDVSREAFALPSLILLDLKLPKRSGLEVLQWVRDRDQFATVPVIVLTSSTEAEDIKRAYERGANSYLRKPVAFNELVRLLTVLGGYWFETNLTAPIPATTK